MSSLSHNLWVELQAVGHLMHQEDEMCLELKIHHHYHIVAVGRIANPVGLGNLMSNVFQFTTGMSEKQNSQGSTIKLKPRPSMHLQMLQNR